MQDLIERLFAATNAFDVEATVKLFAPDAILDDSSVGEKFEGQAGIRRYLEQYFVDYNTVSTVLSVEPSGERRIRARVDFTGDFGHEIGFFDIEAGADGRIVSLVTYLE
jgi:ketosteroid isomerase-like protein